VKRGEIWLADLDPVVGAEIGKARPVVVVSTDSLNEVVSTRRYGVVTVVPVTSNVTKIFPFQVYLPGGRAGLRKDSKALAEQVRCLAVQRVRHRLGSLETEQMRRLDAALRLHLALD
jgi:mRNA interferase MazF